MHMDKDKPTDGIYWTPDGPSITQEEGTLSPCHGAHQSQISPSFLATLGGVILMLFQSCLWCLTIIFQKQAILAWVLWHPHTAYWSA